MLKRVPMLVTIIVFMSISLLLAKDTPAPKDTQRVFAEMGHIYYSSNGRDEIRLTGTGNDRAPVLSPNGKKIAFIRKSYRDAYLPCGGEEDYSPEELLADQIWIVDIDGTNEKMLANDNDPDVTLGYDKWEGADVIAHIDDKSLQFSPDSKKVYFITSAWVTSGALHSVNVDGTEEHFIAGANYLKVIDKGDYKNDFIISQHRYFLKGGSYDWYYVFTPEGKEVGPLIDDLVSLDWDFLYFDSKEE